jgi:hypothetical protein
MQEKQSSPSHKTLNVELWDQISVYLIWVFCCSVDLTVNMWRENEGSCFIPRTSGTHGTGKKSVEFWWGSPKEKRPLEIQRRRWEVGIRMDGGAVNWIRLVQDRDRLRAIVIFRWIYIDMSRRILICGHRYLLGPNSTVSCIIYLCCIPCDASHLR